MVHINQTNFRLLSKGFLSPLPCCHNSTSVCYLNSCFYSGWKCTTGLGGLRSSLGKSRKNISFSSGNENKTIGLLVFGLTFPSTVSVPSISGPDPANMTHSPLKSTGLPDLMGSQEQNPEVASERSPNIRVWWQHHRFWPDLISKAYVLASLSVLTSGETCLPAVAALFIIKPGTFQCRTYNLAFDKAWAQCCQPSLPNWNAFSALRQRKRGFLWSQISPGFQELMQVMAWFCQAVWKNGLKVQHSIYPSGLGWVLHPSHLDVRGEFHVLGTSLSPSLRWRPGYSPSINCPIAAPTLSKMSWKQKGRAGW